MAEFNPKTFPNTANAFSLKIDDLELGTWTGCEGLTAEFDVQSYQEGGQNGYEVKLPGRIKYGNVKLTRYLTGESSQRVAPWFSSFNKKSPKRGHCVITLHSPKGETLAKWTLREAHPLKWSGPQFSTDGNGLLKETIELVHHGFEVS